MMNFSLNNFNSTSLFQIMIQNFENYLLFHYRMRLLINLLILGVIGRKNAPSIVYPEDPKDLLYILTLLFLSAHIQTSVLLIIDLNFL